MIHPHLFYEVREVIVHPLWIIFNDSIPRDWKIAEVIALHKKGSRTKRDNQGLGRLGGEGGNVSTRNRCEIFSALPPQMAHFLGGGTKKTKN